MDSEDQRDVELSTLSAIYPELQTLAEVDPYTFTLDIPVNPAKTVTVYFPASTGQAPDPNSLQAAAGAADGPSRIDSHQLSYLPALRLQISLPTSYPSEQPPVVHVSTKPSWLPEETAQKLESECARLWEELGRDLVIFSYVDHVQQSADDVFGLVSEDGALEISPEHKISILDYDMGAKRAAFEKQTFDCGVCLDPKRGSKCHQMLDCGHVFCVECLQDFYNNAIKGGDVTAVRCLEPNCAKEREDASAKSGKKPRKSKVTISPSELLQIPIEPEMVKRYVTVKYKTELESDKNTIYCPRSWCQGAAKSKKHKKPQGLEVADDDSDDEAEETSADFTNSKAYQPEDRLAVCEDCNFAFCSRCLQSWHGEFVLCAPPRNSKELSEEEKASLEFINLHTTPCPTCNSRAQKTHGCNHMNCFRCHTHFCYLCSAWLDPSNPYAHYNTDNGVMTGCYMRLWDLEEGDQDGDPHFERPAPAQAQNEDAGDIYQALRQGEPQHMQRRRRPDADPNRVILNGQVNLVPEGPRVFRLDVAVPQAGGDNPTQPAAPAAQPPPQQQQARGQARAGDNPRQGRQQQPGPRGRGGRARGGGNRQNQGQRLGQPVFRRDRQFDAQAHEGVAQGDQLEDRDAAWVRNFVQLALEDNEDLALEDDEDMAFAHFD